jgi:RND family efflux transporter MFP subunit
MTADAMISVILRRRHARARRAALLLVLPLAALAALACGKGAGSSASAERASGATPDSATTASTAAGDTSRPRVTLSAAGAATAHIVVEVARADAPAAPSSGLDVPGQVEYDPSRVALISPRTPGRLERLLAVEGDRVGAGQAVALLYSPAFVTAQSDLQQAARRAAVLRGTADAEGADALVAAARRRLTLLGTDAATVRRVEAGGEPATLLPVTAPFAGTIVEAPALAGAAVEAGTPLYRIADLSSVDVTAQVPERALPYLRIGQGASIAIAAYPDIPFAGRVERIKAEIDPTTRTVNAVLHVGNTTRALRPGMYASVKLDVPIASAVGASAVGASAVGASAVGASAVGAPLGASAAPVLTIPETAIVTDASKRFVFVEVGPRTYERRAVQVVSAAPTGTATAASGRVAVLSGLAAGERVVVQGAFTLKSELAKASLGEEE